MIVSFSVSNFRSFAGEQTISLVASREFTDHPEHTVAIPDSTERLLRIAVLYGANGAGKSNVLKALEYLKAVVRGYDFPALSPFRFANSDEQPSIFDLQFIAGGKVYRYGVSIDNHRVHEEWLYRVAGDVQETIFERVTNDAGEVSITESNFAGEKLQNLARAGAKQRRSFLATANGTLDTSDLGGDLGLVIGWFQGNLRLVGPSTKFPRLGDFLVRNPDFREFASTFLRETSTGIDHLNVVTREIPREELARLTQDSALPASIMPIADGLEIIVGEGDEPARQVTVQAAHQHNGVATALLLRDESDGTRRLLDLLPALEHVQSGGAVYFIDEIDRSLHPALVREFISYMLRHQGSGQLIVTTHETNLLDKDLLRRDEIWFAEKDQAGATHVYSLSDYPVRPNQDLREHYLEGRFGAVPFMGDVERLPTR